MTITLTREEAQQVLDALENLASMAGAAWTTDNPIETLRARLAQPELEPDKYLMEIECTKCGAKEDGVLNVTAPPQREWQGLTDEETYGLTTEMCRFAKYIEAKLQEKNT